MAYVAAYQDPDFSQSLPKGRAWQLSREIYFGALLYTEQKSGARAVVPNIWYNQTVAMRAKAMRYYAERADANAANLEASAVGPFAKPWEPANATKYRADAERLRALAAEMERTGQVLA